MWQEKVQPTGKLILVAALFALSGAGGCNDATEIPDLGPADKVPSLITISAEDAQQFFWSETRSFDVSAQQAELAGVVSKPKGWKASLEDARIVVTAPAAVNEAAEATGEITVLALNGLGERITAALSVSVADPRPVFSFTGESVRLGYGEKAAVETVAENISGITFETPAGWTAEYTDEKVCFTAPAVGASGAEKSGTITATAYSPNRQFNVTASIAVAIFEPTDGVNLNADGAFANCYIVGTPDAQYFFNATVQGNNTATGGIEPQTLSPARAAILWTTAPGIVKNLQCTSGYISFETGTISDTDQGSTVVAAYDAADKIIWSWHIWATPYDPQSTNCVYKNGLTVMDRNLGATSNRLGDTDAYGLYYQWGRKDPFVNSVYTTMLDQSGTSIPQEIVGTDDVQATIAYAVENPSTFITESITHGDWIYGGAEAGCDYLWGNPDGYDGRRGVKTIYDPCPKGWSVAPRKIAFDVYVSAAGAPSGNTNNFDYINVSGTFDKGWMFLYDDAGKTTFVPAAGYLFGSWGALQSFDDFSFNWTNSPYPISSGDGASGYGFGYGNAKGCSTLSYGSRGDARSVRCVKE